MNPPTHSEAQPWTLSRWSRLAWLPIPLLLAAIIAARMAGLRDTYESHTLLLVLSFIFYTLVSLGTLYLIGRSFLGSGSPGLLLLECGVLLWSLAGTVGDFVSHGDANINVTIFNTCILLAGLCHLGGTILALKPQRALRAKPLWLGACFAFALGALWLVSQAALMGWLPVFFIPGHGGTPVRYLVLISAIAMFVLSAGLLKVNQRTAHLPFTTWYALALLMLAVGLFGVMIQLSLGSVVNWLSRTAQWLGGIYLLFAAFASLRESQVPLLPMGKQSNPAYYRDAVAAALVLATAAIRLTFLSALGMQAPFVTFFPAVTFASIYGGLRPGLLATALSAILVDYFWIEPAGFRIGQPSDWLAIMIFLLSGAMIAGVSEAMHRARTSATAAEKQALLATERAAAAEALQEGRAKLEAALASMTDAVFISDVEGRFINFNDAFATFHKFRNKDECAKTFAEYPDILDVFMADGTPAPLDQWVVPRALQGETATNAEYTLRRKDTGETWVGSYSFGPIRNKDGMIIGSVVTARDITEHKRIEDAQLFLIKQSGTPSGEDFFVSLARYLGETLGMDYVCIDRLLNDNLSAQTVAIYFDGKYEDNVAYTLKDTPCGDVVGKAICCFPKDVSKLFPNDAVLQEMKAESYVGVTLWSFQGQPIGLIAVIGRKPLANPKLVESILRLVAIRAAAELERRDAEEELKRHADQLEASNKEMESFSYSVSHDLRSPLRAIDGYTRMILRKQGDQFDEDTRSKFNVIRENARMMGQLIDGLLTLSRLGRQELSKSPLNMEELNKGVFEELKAINPDKAIDLKIGHLPSGLGDRQLIKQVLVNLLSNAIKFTKTREVTFIELGGYVIETENVYYVRDNGVGFDMQYYDKLFGVFQRLHSTADYEGTGVGLSIVQRIINRHGGRVWAESEPDRGATFYFSLPTNIGSGL